MDPTDPRSDPSTDQSADSRSDTAAAPPALAESETYNPWMIVNLVFTHLSDQGLHPVLGESGDPGPPARALLVALGIEPTPEGNREVMRGVHAHLAEIRAVVFGEE